MTGQDEVRVRPQGRFITCNSNYEYYIHNGLWLNGHVPHLLSLMLLLLSSRLSSDTTYLHRYVVTRARRFIQVLLLEWFHFMLHKYIVTVLHDGSEGKTYNLQNVSHCWDFYFIQFEMYQMGHI